MRFSNQSLISRMAAAWAGDGVKSVMIFTVAGGKVNEKGQTRWNGLIFFGVKSYRSRA